MKNLIILVILITIHVTTSAQQQKEDKKISATLFAGGLWLGMNNNITFIGIPAAKATITFPISKKTKLETGIITIPGMIHDSKLSTNKNRFGLSIGGMVALRKDWKVKPMLAVTFSDPNKWKPIYGIGILF